MLFIGNLKTVCDKEFLAVFATLHTLVSSDTAAMSHRAPAGPATGENQPFPGAHMQACRLASVISSCLTPAFWTSGPRVRKS